MSETNVKSESDSRKISHCLPSSVDALRFVWARLCGSSKLLGTDWLQFGTGVTVVEETLVDDSTIDTIYFVFHRLDELMVIWSSWKPGPHSLSSYITRGRGGGVGYRTGNTRVTGKCVRSVCGRRGKWTWCTSCTSDPCVRRPESGSSSLDVSYVTGGFDVDRSRWRSQEEGSADGDKMPEELCTQIKDWPRPVNSRDIGEEVPRRESCFYVHLIVKRL